MIEQSFEKIHSASPALVDELPAHFEPVEVFDKLRHLPFPVFLDSSLQHQQLGRYSIIAVDPFDWRLTNRASLDDLNQMCSSWSNFRSESLPGLPTFQGGLINLCSYSLNSCLEKIVTTVNEFDIPDLYFGLYDTVIIFDHQSRRNWIVSHGFPETLPDQRRTQAGKRIRQFISLIQQTSPEAVSVQGGQTTEPLDRNEIFRLRPSNISKRIFSNFTKPEYIEAVQKCIDYIHAGDIFQVNLSQRLLGRKEATAFDVYQKLRTQNPATFSAFLDLGSVQILSSSPERLLSVDAEGKVETRPIKGTRQRSCYPEANLFAAEGLITSEKDRAENVMIVDLLRNDLSKFCHDDSIQVAKLCGIENYEYVQHLVSVIRGQKRSDVGIASILQAIFPGGSITGAPKVRAMEIIAEIEQVSRGAYCGSLGYFGFDGTIDQNILIRTITASKGWLQIPVGGGIVAQSDPVSEYEETIHKAHGMLRCVI